MWSSTAPELGPMTKDADICYKKRRKKDDWFLQQLPGAGVGSMGWPEWGPSTVDDER